MLEIIDKKIKIKLNMLTFLLTTSNNLNKSLCRILVNGEILQNKIIELSQYIGKNNAEKKYKKFYKEAIKTEYCNYDYVCSKLDYLLFIYKIRI